ncbi:tail fiber domain-containing protein [Escherichia coli]|nr:tail fiber domain-containing protein [Escherichia coli]
MVDKLTPRLGLPEPFLTNPLKVDVGRLQQALEMIDTNAVMLTDWDITADGWQKMGTIKGLAQGKIAASLMVVTGTGFANILFQTGDGTVTTVGDPARMTVSAQTSLGANAPTILGGRVVETAADEYEIWFNIAIGTSPRKWSGLLITGNGATIDWTHAMGTQPSDGVELQISRVLTSFDVASDTRTDIGTLLSTGHLGSGVVQLDYLPTVDLKGRMWKTGELVRIKKADATDAKGFPPALVSADPSATGWFIRCLSINDTRTVKEFEFTSESAGIIRAYKARLSGTTWSVAKVYTSLDKPTANDISAIGMRAPVTGTDVVNLNDMYGPDYYGATAIKNTASAVAANNYPFDEVGTVLVLPFGDTFSCTQLYVTQSGRVASRSYDGSTWTTWRKQANSGVNDDITSMTGLTGSFRLGGDGVGDYDAVTMRQLRASSGGGGATMNGVMNNAIGTVIWWNGSRAKIPAGYIPADGQEVSQTDPETRDLFAAVNNDVLVTTDEATWLKAPAPEANGNPANLISKRACYVKNSTTPGKFRVPDLNGVQSNSIQGLYLRGSTSSWTNGPGVITSDQLKDHSHVTYFYVNASRNEVPSANAIRGGGVIKKTPLASTGDPYDTQLDDYTYAANEKYVSAVSTVPNENRYAYVGETAPRSAIGIWLIRSSGIFESASTNFAIINSDTALPSNNTMTYGGFMYSRYTAAGETEHEAAVVSAKKIGAAFSSAILQASDSESGNLANLEVRSNASVYLPVNATTGRSILGSAGVIQIDSEAFATKGLHTNPGFGCGVVAAERNAIELNNEPNTVGFGSYVNWLRGNWYDDGFQFGLVRGGATDIDSIALTSSSNVHGNKQWFFRSSDGRVATTVGNLAIEGSDAKLKDKIVDAADGSLYRINSIRRCEFTWKAEGRRDRGYIAQELEKIDPLYTYDSVCGDEIIKNVSSNAVIADLIGAIQELTKLVKGK